MKCTSNILTAASLAIALLVSSCSESKVSQCQKVLSVATKLEPLGKKLEKDIESIGQPKDPKDIKQLASAFNQASTIFQNSSGDVSKIRTELQGLKLGDEKLKDVQTRYSGNLQELENSLKSLGEVAGRLGKVQSQADLQKALTKEQSALAQNLQQIPKTSEEAKKVESELNTYCDVKPSPTQTTTPAVTPTPAATPK